MSPTAASGERRAMVGYYNQFDYAARVVLRHLRHLEWIRVADPEAGAADDFQLRANGRRIALQVKWSDVDPVVQWGDFTQAPKGGVSVMGKLASAWARMTREDHSPLSIYLVASGRPSANAVRTSALLAATTSETKSFAKFYETSFVPVCHELSLNPDLPWEEAKTRREVQHWMPFWEALEREVNLANFGSFLRALRFEFGAQRANVADALLSDDRKDEQKLAGLFSELVVSPDHTVELERDDLLARLGWTSRIDFRSRHEFPLPMAYGHNRKAESLLDECLDRVGGGYVALIGAAGTGKSTLLSEYTPENTVVIRYFAFVPNDPDFRSARGESESFLHDLTIALDAHYPIGNLAPTDRRGLQERVLKQLEAAKAEHLRSSRKTVIVIDGLDHIPREQDPDRSLLEDLPSPGALGAGVFLVLGSQSISIIPNQAITDSLGSDRVVEIPPLTDDEVAAIVSRTGLDTWLRPGQMEQLKTSCEGHPLALQYLVSELQAIESVPSDRVTLAHEVLERSQIVGGDVSSRYRGYVQSLPQGDDGVWRVLALISRLRVPIDMDWVRTWASEESLRTIEQAARHFFRIEDRVWRFVHNSFRRFLVEETSTVGDRTSVDRDRAWHLELAVLCAQTDAQIWRYYSDEEVPHRFLGGDTASVLSSCDPARLRSMLLDLRPFSVVAEHSQLTLEAAAEASEGDRLASLLLFRSELSLRTMSFENDDRLAAAAVAVDPAALGMDHVMKGPLLRSSPKVAALLAAQLSQRGHLASARTVLDALGGLNGMRSFIESSTRDWSAPLARWAEAIVAVEGVTSALAALDAANPVELSFPDEDAIAELDAQLEALPDDDWRPRRKLETKRDDLLERAAAFGYVRDFVHLAALRHYLAERDDAGARAVVLRMDSEAGIDLRVIARVQWAEQYLRDFAPEQSSPLVAEIVDLLDESDLGEIDDDVQIKLRLRVTLLALALDAEAAETTSRLIPAGTKIVWPDEIGQEGDIGDFEPVIRALTIEALLPNEASAPFTLEQPRSPADRRIGEGLRALCRSEVLARSGRDFVRADVVSIVRMVSHIPKSTPGESVRWTRLRRLGPQVLARLVRTTSRVSGTGNFATIRDLLDETWADPDVGRDWTPASRIKIAQAFADDVAWATTALQDVEAAIQADPFEPFEAVELWLALAEAWNQLGNRSRAFAAMRSAVTSGLGVGIHESDDQLESWPTWIPDAVASGADPVEEIENFASRLGKVASVDANLASRAAAQLVRTSWGLDAEVARRLTDSLSWSGPLKDTDHLEQVAAAVIDDREIDEEVALLITERLLLPTRRGSSQVVVQALRRFADHPVAQDRVLLALSTCLVDSDRDRWTMDLAEVWEETTATASVGTAMAAGPLARWIRTASAAGTLDWEQCPALDVEGSTDVVDLKALFGLMRQHGASPVHIASVAAQLARRGEIDLARDGLNEAARFTQKNGWNRQWDGGSRRKFWEAATTTGVPEIKQLAARDLARSLRGGYHYEVTAPSDLAALMRIVAFEDPRGRMWQSVTEFLDHYAPVGDPVDLDVRGHGFSRNAEALTWAMGFLDHPIRQLDVGARCVISGAISAEVSDAQRTVAQYLTDADCGSQESILHALVSVDQDVAFGTELTSVVRSLGTSDDAIVRFLAAKLSSSRDISLDISPGREFSISTLVTPPLIGGRLAPLGTDGIPVMDPTQPKHNLAPFDRIVESIAAALSIDDSYLLHRTSDVARNLHDRWLIGGTQAHAERLKTRGMELMFRPWHYMAGRRATARLVAELVDGGLAPLDSVDYLDLLCVGLDALPAQPLPASIPMPLSGDDTSGHATPDWEAQAGAAAEMLSESVRQSVPFVLAEIGEFQSLAWETPVEHRRVLTGMVRSHSLWTPTPRTQEMADYRADQYFDQRVDVDVREVPLVVQGQERFADAALVVGTWVAINPWVAYELGWNPLLAEPFAFSWVGDDGEWRARSRYFSIGQLSQRPPSFNDFVAQVWQAQLSDLGLSELSAFAQLSRTVMIKRQKPGRARDEPGVQEVRPVL